MSFVFEANRPGTMKRVSVLVPIYSEVHSVAETVRLVEEDLGDRLLEIWLLVHRDSNLECWEMCRTLEREVEKVRLRCQHRYPGQGCAYREGIELAEGDYILLLNADLETEPRHCRRLLEELEARDADLVVGSRWMSGSYFDSGSYGRLKKFLNFGMQKLFAKLLKVPLSELTFAFKIARAEVFKNTLWIGIGHEFAFESTVKPAMLGYRVSEVPTSWVGRTEGKSKQAFRRNLRHPALGVALWIERWLDPIGFVERYRLKGAPEPL